MNTKFIIISLVLFILFASVLDAADNPKGTIKAGYVFTDEVGNNSVYQPSYNIYEGLGLSLEDFSYQLENGTRFFGDLKNVTLQNRNLIFGAAKTGLFSARFSHNEYRRQYSFAGDKSSKRKNSNASFWAQVHRNIRVFGGYGQINKTGESLDLTGPAGFIGENKFDYSQKYFNSGVRFGYASSFLEFDFRGSNFNDVLNTSNNRNTRQYRVTGSAPIPKFKGFYINGGFQHFNLELPNIDDTLTANTGWGGLRYFNRNGYHVKYSFIWDRARRTTDLAATDNITNAVYAGKEWQGKAGITLGYSYRINDDINDELKANGYSISSWFKPHYKVTLRASYGSELTDVESGTTLTGDRDFTRYNVSATYKFNQGNWRVKVENKKTENKSIGSIAEYTKAGTDVTLTIEKYGELLASYDFLNGDFTNVDGDFKFSDNVFWGNALSKRYKNFQAGVGGTYVRSRQDLDVESFSLRFSGNYAFGQGNEIEIVYTVQNFDDFRDPSPIYSRYYTANIVEISISREF